MAELIPVRLLTPRPLYPLTLRPHDPADHTGTSPSGTISAEAGGLKVIPPTLGASPVQGWKP